MHSMKGFPCSDSNGFDRARCLQCKNGNCPDMGYNAEKYNDGGGKILGRHFLYTTKSVPFCGKYLVNRPLFGSDNLDAIIPKNDHRSPEEGKL